MSFFRKPNHVLLKAIPVWALDDGDNVFALTRNCKEAVRGVLVLERTGNELAVYVRTQHESTAVSFAWAQVYYPRLFKGVKLP